jgi:D-3-phosphoglycerate dehydrogenase
VAESFSHILPGHELVWHETGSDEGLKSALKDTHYLVVVNHLVDSGLIEGSDIRMISVSFTGYNHIDLDACRKKNIAVTIVPGYSTNSVTELTIAMAVSLLRKISFNGELVKNGKWHAAETGSELYGKTVGIIGTGQIGIAVARILHAFGCRVLGYSRSQRKEFISAGGEYRELNDLLNESDIVSLHLPLNEKTMGLIGEAELEKMKPSAILLNLSRGGLVNEVDLAAALQTKKIAGAGLDVFETEPLPQVSPLLSAPNLLLTPHMGYRTKEALLRKVDSTFQNIADFEAGKSTNRVDQLQ